MRGAWLVGPTKSPLKRYDKRGMVVPVADQAAQQSGIPQEGRIGGRRAADQDVISAAGAGVPAIEHEFFRGQAAEARFFVERRRVLDQFIPACGRMQVHFDHAGVGRDFDRVDARIVRRGIAFDEHGHPQVGGRILDRRDQARDNLRGSAAAA